MTSANAGTTQGPDEGGTTLQTTGSVQTSTGDSSGLPDTSQTGSATITGSSGTTGVLTGATDSDGTTGVVAGSTGPVGTSGIGVGSTSFASSTDTGGSEYPCGFTDIVAWWRADFGITVNGSDDVTEWLDYIDSYAAAEHVPFNLPHFEPGDAGSNNLPYVSFGGADSLFVQGTFPDPANDELTVVMIMKQNSDGGAQRIFDWSNNAAGPLTGFAVEAAFARDKLYLTLQLGVIGPHQTNGRYTFPTQYVSLMGWFDHDAGNPEVKVYVKGVQELSMNTTGDALTYTLDTFIIGKSLDGDIGEILVYDRPLGDTDRACLDSYAATKFGFSL